jgi:hypothetical protein
MEWKCMRYVNIEPEVEEMYHISLDPLESNNLVNDVKYKGIRDQMAGRYEQKYPSVLHSRAGAR